MEQSGGCVDELSHAQSETCCIIKQEIFHSSESEEPGSHRTDGISEAAAIEERASFLQITEPELIIGSKSPKDEEDLELNSKVKHEPEETAEPVPPIHEVFIKEECALEDSSYVEENVDTKPDSNESVQPTREVFVPEVVCDDYVPGHDSPHSSHGDRPGEDTSVVQGTQTDLDVHGTSDIKMEVNDDGYSQEILDPLSVCRVEESNVEKEKRDPIANEEYNVEPRLSDHPPIYTVLPSDPRNTPSTRTRQRKTLVCNQCGFTSTKISDMTIHTRIHTGVKPYSCSECEYRAARKRSLIEHMRLHTGEKPYSCSECNYRSATRSCLTVHMKIHNGEELFKCDQCGYNTTKKNNLAFHMMRMHTEDKPFSCTECDYRTVRKDQLVKHMGIHSDDKPFSCDECDYRSVRKCDLTRHMMIHSDDKPFNCTLCDYSTVRKAVLTRHMWIHTDDKPFRCSVCSYGTVQRCDLTRHMASVHNND